MSLMDYHPVAGPVREAAGIADDGESYLCGACDAPISSDDLECGACGETILWGYQPKVAGADEWDDGKNPEGD